MNAVVGRHQADRGGKYQAIAAMRKLTQVLRTIAFEALYEPRSEWSGHLAWVSNRDIGY
jgi:hypothetical protein